MQNKEEKKKKKEKVASDIYFLIICIKGYQKLPRFPIPGLTMMDTKMLQVRKKVPLFTDYLYYTPVTTSTHLFY